MEVYPCLARLRMLCVDGKHVVVSNRVDSTISIIDYTTLTNAGDITGLMPGPDDMELTPDKRYLWVGFRFRERGHH